MRLLPQIENSDRTTGARQEKLETIGRKLSAAGSAEVGQTAPKRTLVAFSESFVVRKLRGRVSFRLRSVSQITTGDFASGGGFGGVFCTRGADKVIAGATRRIKRAIVKTLSSAVALFIRLVSGESVYLVESTESTAIPQCWGLITLLTNCRANELVNCGHCHCHCHWFFEVLRARWIQDVIDKDVAKQPLQLNVKG